MFPICYNAIIIYTILLLSAKYLTFSYEWQQNFDITRNLSEALVEIIENLFVETSQRKAFNFLLKVTNKNKQYLRELERIVDATMPLLNDTITVQLRNGIAILPDNERHFCVLLVDSSESLEYLYKNLNRFHLFLEGSYFIILRTYPNVHHYYDELFEIFQLNWLNGITHADVLVHAVHNVILMFHSMPFTPFHCKGAAPIIHNKFVDGRWLHKKFLTAKSRNLYGCPLVCATWEDMPYFHLDHEHSIGKRRNKYIGLEGRLLQYLSDKMNFTVTMRWLNDKEINQTVYDEQGVFVKLFSANTDFVVGAFHYKPTSLEDPYVPTTSYYLSNYRFILSAKADAYNSFQKLLLPFGMEIWIILVLIFVFVNMILFMFMSQNRKLKSLVLGRENKTPAYNMVVISLGGAVAKDPKVPFSRFLLMLWLLATFILRTIYQGNMFYFIKSDLHKPPPALINDLLHKEYRILMSDVVSNSVVGLPTLFKKAEVINASELEMFEMLRHPKDYEPYKLAILSAIEYFGHYIYTTPTNNDFYVLPQKLFTQQLSIYMKKNSVYLKRFNLYINRYVTEGLMNRWVRLLVVSENSHRLKDDGPRPMKNSHLFAAYRLLFMGLAASLLVFFVEIFIAGMNVFARQLRERKSKKSKKLNIPLN